jgi:hypothetical protein
MLIIGVSLLFVAIGLYAASMTYDCRRYEKVLLVVAVVVNAATIACVSPIPSLAFAVAVLAFVMVPWRIVAIAMRETWGGSDSYKYEEYPGTVRTVIEMVRIQGTVRL